MEAVVLDTVPNGALLCRESSGNVASDVLVEAGMIVRSQSCRERNSTPGSLHCLVRPARHLLRVPRRVSFCRFVAKIRRFTTEQHPSLVAPLLAFHFHLDILIVYLFRCSHRTKVRRREKSVSA